MTGRILVAGVGNVFLRDDAFGVEVVRLLAERPQRPGVQIRDYGIRGVHLVYELLNGYDLFVLVDAAPRGDAPGTVTVLEVDLPSADAQPVIDAHSLTPDAIFGLLSSLGGHPGRSLVVACEPAEVDAGMGLSDPVRAALPHAVRAVEEILAAAGDGDQAAGQECMADLARHRDEPTQEGGAQDAEQADQGGPHRRDAGGGDRFTTGHQAVSRNSRDVALARQEGGEGVEVVFGFAVGYFIGIRQGRKGLQEAIESVQAIMASPETRRMLSEAISSFETVAGPTMERMERMGRRSGRGSRAALIGSVVDELIERRARRAA